jgi:hypothetical protein
MTSIRERTPLGNPHRDQIRESYLVVSLLDSAARQSVRRQAEDRDSDIDVFGPPYLPYVSLDSGGVSKRTFCEGTAEMS